MKKYILSLILAVSALLCVNSRAEASEPVAPAAAPVAALDLDNLVAEHRHHCPPPRHHHRCHPPRHHHRRRCHRGHLLINW